MAVSLRKRVSLHKHLASGEGWNDGLGFIRFRDPSPLEDWAGSVNLRAW